MHGRNALLLGVLALAPCLACPQSQATIPDIPRPKIRVLVVSNTPQLADMLAEADDVEVIQVPRVRGWYMNPEPIDADVPAYAQVLVLADVYACDFVALEAPPWADWGLDPLPPKSVPFVVFSLGEHPRMHFVDPNPLALVDYEPPLDELESIRLALYEHPDMPDDAIHPRSAATPFEFREDLRALLDAWPMPAELGGGLGGPLEGVRASPIRGGLLLEVQARRLLVGVDRRARLSEQVGKQVWFVPTSALGEKTILSARQRCAGIDDYMSKVNQTMPDGRTFVHYAFGWDGPTWYRVDEQAAADQRCVVDHIGWVNDTMIRDEHGAGYHDRPKRANTAGYLAWSVGDDLIWSPGDGTTAKRTIPHVGQFSGPWWIGDKLLVMVADHPRDPPEQGFARVLALKHLGEFGLRIGMDELFSSDALELLEVWPVADNELLVQTDRCAGAPPTDARRCLHRLRSEGTLSDFVKHRVTDQAANQRLEVESIGPIDPHVSLVIAANGQRATWIATAPNGEAQLMMTDLQGPNVLTPRQVSDGLPPVGPPQISADGRVIVSAAIVEVPGIEGSTTVARAFMLPPPALE